MPYTDEQLADQRERLTKAMQEAADERGVRGAIDVAVGAASMAWTPRPKDEVFDSTWAGIITEALADILEPKDSIATVGPDRLVVATVPARGSTLTEMCDYAVREVARLLEVDVDTPTIEHIHGLAPVTEVRGADGSTSVVEWEATIWVQMVMPVHH